jgi:hypothetical protein
LEIAVRGAAARVDDALGNSLVIEVRDLLAEVEILEKRGSALPGLQGVLVVVDARALVRREDLPRAVLLKDTQVRGLRIQRPIRAG